jgi:hypothetical protein
MQTQKWGLRPGQTLNIGRARFTVHGIRGDKVYVEVGETDESRDRAYDRLQRLIELLQQRPDLLRQFARTSRRLSQAAGHRPVPARAAWEAIRVKGLGEHGIGMDNSLAALAARLAVAQDPSLRGCLATGHLRGITLADLLNRARDAGVI